MHGQAHALHFLQVRQKTLAAVHRDVHEHLIQRTAAQPIHKVVIISDNRHTGDIIPDSFFVNFQQRQAHNALGPVLLQIVDYCLGIEIGRYDCHIAFYTPTVFCTSQHPLKNRMTN